MPYQPPSTYPGFLDTKGLCLEEASHVAEKIGGRGNEAGRRRLHRNPNPRPTSPRNRDKQPGGLLGMEVTRACTLESMKLS